MVVNVVELSCIPMISIWGCPFGCIPNWKYVVWIVAGDDALSSMFRTSRFGLMLRSVRYPVSPQNFTIIPAVWF
jgi:hypothetical protein